MDQFSDKQKDAMRHAISDNFTYLATGSVRSGKTYASMFGFFVYTQALKEKRTHVVASRNLRVLEMELIPALEDFATSFNVPYNYTKFDALATTGNQQYYMCAGHDEASHTRLQGLTVHSVLADECTLYPEVFWKTLLSRCTFDDSKLWATCNPQGKRHWLKKDYIDQGKIDNIQQFTFDDNPILGEQTKQRNADLFSGVFYKRMILGEWADAEGKIYEQYTVKNVHYSQDDIRRIDLGVDYATKTTFAAQKLVTLKSGLQILESTLRYDAKKTGKQKTDSEYVDMLVEFMGKDRIQCVYVDPSASSFIVALRRVPKRLFHVRVADNAVLDGIRVCMNLLTKEKVIIQDNKSNAPLLDELADYVWDEKKEDDLPKKINDHHVDAMRYVVYSLNKRGSSHGTVTLPEGM